MQSTTPDTPRPLWVFGYGSLIWDPGFPFVDKQVAILPDYERSFCMRSIHHRGTVDDPGLVLALDHNPGEACRGIAFRVDDNHAVSTVDYLRERELISSAYLEEQHEVALVSGDRVTALTYVVDRDHVQYCGGLELETQAQIISTAVGGRGPNTDYLWNTVSGLDAIGISDTRLTWLAGRVRDITRSRI